MAKLTGRSVKTYSIGYESKHNYYNELNYAKLVADAFSTDHHEIIVRPQMTELLPKLVWHLDEPVADSACLTTYLVSRLARQSVTVILSGVGGDELFGGYRRYLGDSVLAWYRFLPSSIRRRWLPALLKRVPRARTSASKDYARYAAAFIETAERESAGRYMSYVTLFSPLVQQELLCRRLINTDGQNDSAEALHKYFARYVGGDSLQRIIYTDLKTSLPDDLLALTDRMSMAASIECRAPLLDHELIELTTRMPSSLKVRGLSLKYLLKKAVAPWLPREIVNRKKRGFGAPIGAWMREDLQPLIAELLSQEQVQRRGLFQWQTIKQLLDAHQKQQCDYTDQLFALIIFELWCRNFLDRKPINHDLNALGSAAVLRTH
jgi:asparagine synthase (glutamine-hydrolysing)